MSQGLLCDIYCVPSFNTFILNQHRGAVLPGTPLDLLAKEICFDD